MTQSELRRQVDSDQSPVTRDGYMQLRNDIYNKVNTAMIDSSAAKTLLDDLAGIEAKQFKDEANNAALLSPDRATRLAFGGTGADKEAVNLWYKRFAGAYPNDAERMAAMVEYGVQSTNPDMVTAGTKEILPAIENMLLMPPDKFDTTATVQQKQVWSSFVGAYNRAKLTSPGLANKMMDAFSPDMRAAVDEIIDAPYTGRNVGADMKTIQAVMEQRRATVAGGGFAGSVTSNFSFTPDMVSSSMWGRFAPNWLGGESDSIRAKNFWLQPNDAGAQYITGQLNLAMQGGAKDYLLKQERQGRLINSPSQIVSALKDGKYILPLETGVANINPTWYSKVADGYKARFNYGLNDETVSAAVSALQDQYFQKFNGKDGRDFDREDVQATVVGDILMVKAYKNGAALPFETQKWGVSMVHEAAYNVLKRRADVAAPPITGSVMYGKQSMDLTPDWDRTFTGGLKQHIAQSLLKHEGTTMKVHTPDKNRPNIQTIGMGINLTGNLANEPLRKAVVAAHATGDKRKIDAATGAFIADYYKGFPKLVASAGLPPMEKSNVVNGTPAYVALANAHYQSPLAGQEYAKLLSIAKTDPAKAKQMFRTSAAYKDIDSASNGKAEKSDRVRLYDAGFDAMKRVNAVDGWYTRNFNKPLVSMLPKASDFNLPMR
jgi:hypothetical protein